MFSNVHRYLTAEHAQVSITTYHNDPACPVSIVGGTRDVLYSADNGTVIHGARVPKDAHEEDDIC
jgi:hypothetical protein